MVTFSRVGLKGEVGSVLVGSVVPQGELNCTTVDTGALAVGARKVTEPSNATKELTLNSGRPLRGGVILVQEDRSAAAVATHLWEVKRCSVFAENTMAACEASVSLP